MKLLGRESVSKGYARSKKQGLVLAKDQECQSPKYSLITLDALVQEQMVENLFDRVSGSDVAANTGDEKGGDEVEKDDDVDEYVEQKDGKGVVVAEEKAKVDEEEEDESDVSE
ncbi:hypothetical protein Dimus_013386 [Dionaea muscipula]